MPERVTRLAAIEGFGPPTSNPDDSPTNLRKALAQMHTLPGKRLPVYPSLEAAIQTRCEASGLSWRAASILVERGVKPVGDGFGWRTDPRLRFVSPLYLAEPQILAYMARIQAQALLLCGEAGYLVRRAYMQNRYARVAHLTVKIIPGGHHPHLEDPENCARWLEPFLMAD